jgi:Cysteine-rich CWC
MMSTCAGQTSPQQQQSKICEACGKEFLCKAMAAGCWCEEIHLTAAAREEISRRYRDCLCRDCLSRFQAEDGFTPTQNPNSI